MQHEALEARLDLSRADFGRDELAALLARFYGYYAPCEAQIGRLPEPLPELLADRVKAPLLEADLRALGYSEQAIKELPRYVPPVPDSAAAALGRWYVFEGSTLGGQMLARRFESELGLTDGGCSFFRSYGDAVGARWREYCELLDSNEIGASNDEAVCEARRTFETLGQWLCGGRA